MNLIIFKICLVQILLFKLKIIKEILRNVKRYGYINQLSKRLKALVYLKS